MMRMFAVALAIVACASLTVSAGETTETPEGVLAQLEEIYAAGDIDAYRDLLAEDFEFVSKTGSSWGKREDLAGTSKLFQSSQVSLAFTRNFTMRPGKTENTWILEQIPLRMETTQDSDSYAVDAVLSLSLRRNPTTGFIQIFKWVDKTR